MYDIPGTPMYRSSDIATMKTRLVTSGQFDQATRQANSQRPRQTRRQNWTSKSGEQRTILLPSLCHSVRPSPGPDRGARSIRRGLAPAPYKHPISSHNPPYKMPQCHPWRRSACIRAHPSPTPLSPGVKHSARQHRRLKYIQTMHAIRSDDCTPRPAYAAVANFLRQVVT